MKIQHVMGITKPLFQKSQGISRHHTQFLRFQGTDEDLAMFSQRFSRQEQAGQAVQLVKTLIQSQPEAATQAVIAAPREIRRLALHFVVSGVDRPDLIRLLVQQGQVPVDDILQGDRSLIEAIDAEHAGNVTALLELKAKVNAISDREKAPVLEASGKSSDVLKAVLDFKPDLKVHDNWGYGPLMIAADRDKLDNANLLIEHHVDLNDRANGIIGHKRTAVFIAVEKFHRAVAKRLIEVGARFDLADEYGMTTMHQAACTGEADLLMDMAKRATAQQLNLTDDYGRTVLDSGINYVGYKGMPEVFYLMETRGAKLSPESRRKLKTWVDHYEEWKRAHAAELKAKFGK